MRASHPGFTQAFPFQRVQSEMRTWISSKLCRPHTGPMSKEVWVEKWLSSGLRLLCYNDPRLILVSHAEKTLKGSVPGWGKVHSFWCWIPIMLPISGGVGHGSLEMLGWCWKWGGWASFWLLLTNQDFWPISDVSEMPVIKRNLRCALTGNGISQAIQLPSEIHCPPLCCMLAFLTQPAFGRSWISKKELSKSIWRCILLIFMENKQADFSSLWLSANKNSVPFAQNRYFYILLKASQACI